MSYGVWKDKDVETVRKMWRENASATDISVALDRRYTRNAVLGKIHRLGLVRSPTVRTDTAKAAIEAQREQREEARRRARHLERLDRLAERAALAMESKAQPEAKILPLPNAIICHPVDIMGLKEGLCRFIVDDGLALYCGGAARPGGSWCPGHHRIVFKPAQQPERKRRAA